MRVRVYIATTEGPVLIQRIAPEDDDIPPVVCVNGTTETLPISGDYARFVRRGTGVVAALTGHGSYRVDLDGSVDGGRSWQLGLLLAHLLAAEGRLAGPEDPDARIVVATGEVDRDLNVRSVDFVSEKVRKARVLGVDGAELLFFAPGDSGAVSGVTAVSSLAEAAARLNLDLPYERRDAPLPVPTRPARRGGDRRLGPAIGAVTAIIVVAAIAMMTTLRYGEDDSGPETDRIEMPGSSAAAPVAFSVTSARAPDGFTCRSLRFAGLDTVASRETGDASGVVRSPDRATLCSVGYRIENRSGGPVRVVLHYEGEAPTAGIDTDLAADAAVVREWRPEDRPDLTDVAFVVEIWRDGSVVHREAVRHRIDPAGP